MKFGIITHAIHKLKNGHIYGYEPFVREMNLWGNYVDEIIVLAPISSEEITSVEIRYQHPNIKIVSIPSINITSFKNLARCILVIPKICLSIYKVMKSSDHIHLRCPGNIGLLGALIQLFFPSKPKTAKYAGNWDPKSKQPVSYQIQKWILSTTFFTRKMKVLVYGAWPNQTKNIIPFFTASYFQNEIEEIPRKTLTSKVKLLYVGSLTKSKQPLLSVKSTHELIKKGYNVQLEIYGDGIMRSEVENYIKTHELENSILLYGNVNKETIKNAFRETHFLIFISKSEGWPKVVAEAMFWRCLPISSNVSCVSYMLNREERGSLVNIHASEKEISKIIVSYIKNENVYQKKVLSAQIWSRKYTLNRFQFEIKRILENE
jgi:glycosyltransferase involved in cell wall biosynthesis